MFGGAPRRMLNSVVDQFRIKPHHRDTEDAEVAQRRARSRLFVQSPPFSEVERLKRMLEKMVSNTRHDWETVNFLCQGSLVFLMGASPD